MVLHIKQSVDATANADYRTKCRADCTSWSVGVGLPLLARTLSVIWRCDGRTRRTFKSCIGPLYEGGFSALYLI